jgi:hypothetical protein
MITNLETPQEAQGPLQIEASQALREAVWGVIQEHKQLRMPLSILRDGKIVRISPEEAEAEYLAKKADFEAAQAAAKNGGAS